MWGFHIVECLDRIRNAPVAVPSGQAVEDLHVRQDEERFVAGDVPDEVDIRSLAAEDPPSRIHKDAHIEEIETVESVVVHEDGIAGEDE